MRIFLLTAAVLAALMATGLGFGWHVGVFDDPAWRADTAGWGWASVGLFAASCHWLADEVDHRYGRWSQ